jgi:transposase-like protein
LHRFYQTPAAASVWIDALAAQYGLNPKTVAKWRKRTSVGDAAMGPKDPRPSVTPQEEAIAVAFRRHTLLPLDDCLYALRPPSRI